MASGNAPIEAREFMAAWKKWEKEKKNVVEKNRNANNKTIEQAVIEFMSWSRIKQESSYAKTRIAATELFETIDPLSPMSAEDRDKVKNMVLDINTVFSGIKSRPGTENIAGILALGENATNVFRTWLNGVVPVAKPVVQTTPSTAQSSPSTPPIAVNTVPPIGPSSTAPDKKRLAASTDGLSGDDLFKELLEILDDDTYFSDASVDGDVAALKNKVQNDAGFQAEAGIPQTTTAIDNFFGATSPSQNLRTQVDAKLGVTEPAIKDVVSPALRAVLDTRIFVPLRQRIDAHMQVPVAQGGPPPPATQTQVPDAPATPGGPTQPGMLWTILGYINPFSASRLSASADGRSGAELAQDLRDVYLENTYLDDNATNVEIENLKRTQMTVIVRSSTTKQLDRIAVLFQATTPDASMQTEAQRVVTGLQTIIRSKFPTLIEPLGARIFDPLLRRINAVPVVAALPKSTINFASPTTVAVSAAKSGAFTQLNNAANVSVSPTNVPAPDDPVTISLNGVTVTAEPVGQLAGSMMFGKHIVTMPNLVYTGRGLLVVRQGTRAASYELPQPATGTATRWLSSTSPRAYVCISDSGEASVIELVAVEFPTRPAAEVPDGQRLPEFYEDFGIDPWTQSEAMPLMFTAGNRTVEFSVMENKTTGRRIAFSQSGLPYTAGTTEALFGVRDGTQTKLRLPPLDQVGPKATGFSSAYPIRVERRGEFAYLKTVLLSN